MKHKVPSSAKLIREVLLEAQPHTLKRPVRRNLAGEVSAGEQNKKLVVNLDPDQLQRELDLLKQSAFEQGLLEGKKEGFEQGWQEGFEKSQTEGFHSGLTRADAAIEEEIAKHTQRLEQFLTSIKPAFIERFAALEDDMVVLVQCAVTRVMGEAVTSSEGTRLIIQQAIRELSSRDLIAIRVHPDDVNMLKADATLSQLLLAKQASSGILWIADDRIKLGGCLLDTLEGTLDARLETQLSLLTEELLNVRRIRASQPDEADRAGVKA